MSIDPLAIAYITIAILALPHVLSLGRALILPPQAAASTPIRKPAPVVAGQVSEDEYRAAVLVIRRKLEQDMHAELAKVISVGPVS